MITYAIVIAAYLIMELMVKSGNISSLLKGQLVPICYYVILAVSLNLTVGILGELSLGHAGFMCVGAFASSLFSICMVEAIPVTAVRFTPVSYTHLDVYKRQVQGFPFGPLMLTAFIQERHDNIDTVGCGCAGPDNAF